MHFVADAGKVLGDIEAAAAAADARFRFGGWQDASDSDSSEEGEDRNGNDSDEADEPTDLDDAAKAALDELRQLAIAAQQQHQQAEEESPVSSSVAASSSSGDAPVLSRHDTPLGIVADDRFRENTYGTPPPHERKDHQGADPSTN